MSNGMNENLLSILLILIYNIKKTLSNLFFMGTSG